MQKLLEQAQTLVADLQSAKIEVANQKAVLDKQRDSQVIVQKNLDDFQIEILQRENNIIPIENAQKTIDSAEAIKAEADLQASKVAGEWGALKAAKQKHESECQAELNKIEDDKELYARGAKENAIVREKLDARLKKLAEAGV